MAFYTETQTIGLGAKLAHAITEFRAAAAKSRTRRRVTRQTFNELASLSNRDLNDLGIARSEIRALALEAGRNAV